ncbi:MAG: SDR family oxidoreductase [Labilithrix sp.]|nr:SDR family oxidoreductase [Labilithrix sp.]
MKGVRELFRVDGRVAIVTGGAGHLGGAFCEALAELGASIVVVDRELESCTRRTEELTSSTGARTLALGADLGRDDTPSEIVRETLRAFGRIDILINNAAFTGVSKLDAYAVPFREQSVEAWDAAMRVNLTAVFALVRASEAALAASGRGCVINVASIYGLVGPDMSLYEGTPMGNPAAYAASKGGLVQLTRYLATVLAPNVRVNCLSPGGILRGQPRSFVEKYCARTPLGRMGEEEDFKGALAFLASDASAYMTGHNLVVDGGWTSW